MTTAAGRVRDTQGPTRERILDAAVRLVLDRGFAGTTLDLLLKEAGITKGAFFYHFKSKAELGRALLDRHARDDVKLMANLLERAGRLSNDPLQQVLIVVGLLEEMARSAAGPPEGCLYATYAYEMEQFEPNIRQIIADAILDWRRELGWRLRAAIARHPPRIVFDPDQVADLLTTVVEGAYIMRRVFKSPLAFAEQLHHYRNYLELLFGLEAPTGGDEGGGSNGSQ